MWSHAAAETVSPVARLTQTQRDRVATFLSSVVDWSGKRWDDIANEAYREGVPYTTIQGWRYKRSTPEAPGLIEFLRAAGLLDENYRIVVPKPEAGRLAEATADVARRGAALDERLNELEASPRPKQARG